MNAKQATDFSRKVFVRLYRLLYGAEIVAAGDSFFLLQRADGTQTGVFFDPSTELLSSWKLGSLPPGEYGAYSWAFNPEDSYRPLIREHPLVLRGVDYAPESVFLFSPDGLARLSRKGKWRTGYPKRSLQELMVLAGVVHEMRHERQAWDEVSPLCWKKWRRGLQVSASYPPFNTSHAALTLSHRNLVKSYRRYRSIPQLHRFLLRTEEDTYLVQFRVMTKIAYAWIHNRKLALKQTVKILKN